MRVMLCRVCLCAALLMNDIRTTVDAAPRNATQEVIDDIHVPGTTGTPASNFTADTNYTAITNTISTTQLKSRFTTAMFAALQCRIRIACLLYILHVWLMDSLAALYTMCR